MDALKDSLRAQGATHRAAAHAACGMRAGEAIRDRFLARIPFSGSIGGYWAVGDEVDVGPLLEDLFARGHPIGLPAMETFNGDVQFRRWRPGDTLIAGPHGLPQPAPEADVIRPSVMLLPLLAFDRRCNPLTDGIGPYWRLHTAMSPAGQGRRPLAVGIAYATQRADAVPLRVLEHQVDYVVTESDIVERPVPARWERVLGFLCGTHPP